MPELLHQRFIDMAKKQKSKPAFIDRTTGRRVTYEQSVIASLLLARLLRNFNDRHIGIMLPASAGCGLTILGALFAGKIPVMINYSTGAENNVLYARGKCGFRVVVTTRGLLKKVDCPEMPGMVFIEDLLGKIGMISKTGAVLKAKLPASWLKNQVHKGKLDDTAVVIFTSGSEKEPKAVELTHRNIASNVEAMAQAFNGTEQDIMLSVLPPFHVFGFTTTLWEPLYIGQSMVTYGNPLEFKTIARIIVEEKPTIVVGTPYFLMGYLKQSQPGDFESLRLVIAGADRLPSWVRKAYQEQHGLDVIEGYGATETSPVISVNPLEANRPGSIGKPLEGVQVKIVDIDSGEDLGTGQEGKIMVKGDLVMKGYYGDMEETALRIENGWYETGDMGVLDEDGYLWHHGRLKRFVKIAGEMVSLPQIEGELEKLLPADIEYCAIELLEGKKGSEIAVALNKEINLHAIKTKLSKQLPPIAQPRRFIVLPELPKMGSGKVDFRKTTDQVRKLLRAS